MFTDLYIETTNPHLTIKQFLSQILLIKMGSSVIFHTLIYAGSINLFYYIFSGNFLSSLINTRILLFLLIVMSLGFLGRFYHVKEIYSAYKNQTQAKEYVDKTYITWYFLS
jgi:hypothetical protein